MTAQQEDHLAMARRHIVEGEQRILRQTERIVELTRDGHDTIDAEALLVTLKDALAAMYVHLQIIQDEISGSPIISSP